MDVISVRPSHIYIHWPFCRNKCYYCDFISFEKHEGFQVQYHEALCNQIKKYCKKNNCNSSTIKTIFFGGGSPSLYPLDLLKELFEILNDNFNLNNLTEVTIEANPADITQEKLECWKDLGINRLSIGIQLLDDEILHEVNRVQDIENVFKIMDLAPKFFENISIDLILGLPGTTEKIWKDTLSTVVNWPIKHISVYLLTVYENTPLFFRVEQNQLSVLKDLQMCRLYEFTVDFLIKNGLDQYEISNFAKDGFESVHNIAYWERKAYIGFGLGAASFDGNTRFVNEKNLIRYITSCNQDQNYETIYYFEEKLNQKDELLEKLMLGLRLKKGVALHSMLYSLSGDQRENFLKNLEVLKSEFLIKEDGGRIYLTTKGMLLENEIILKLL